MTPRRNLKRFKGGRKASIGFSGNPNPLVTDSWAQWRICGAECFSHILSCLSDKLRRCRHPADLEKAMAHRPFAAAQLLGFAFEPTSRNDDSIKLPSAISQIHQTTRRTRMSGPSTAD